MEDCIFCKIVKGEIPAFKVYEDSNVYAFLDNGPVNPGHTLVIPKKHSRNVLEMNEKDLSVLIKKIRQIAIAVEKSTNAEGINIIFNNEKAAGQAVFHTHAHIVPRFNDDGYKWWAHGEYQDGEAEKVASKISANI